jgi:predicted RNA-binding Zn-ribbon protein involved in translation (DUF1610 family)
MDRQLDLLNPRPTCHACGSEAGVVLAGIFVCSVCGAGEIQNDVAARKVQGATIKATKKAEARRRFWDQRRRRRGGPTPQRLYH